MSTRRPYFFKRNEGFYCVYLATDEEACENAKANHGTLAVYNADGRVVWPAANNSSVRTNNNENKGNTVW